MGALTLAVTGAGGRLGRATVAAALARGHRVRAVLRRPAQMPDGVQVTLCDLADPGPELARALTGADAVLHLAASLGGDDARQARDTVAATRNLYAVAGAPVVLAGSMAVYQGRAGMVDETSPLEPEPEARDAYARAKLAQEETARAAAAGGLPGTILRIGALTGPGLEWNAHLGLRIGPVLLLLAGPGALPLVRLEDAAQALVLAAERPMQGLEIFNIIGENLPSARQYLAQIPQNARPPLTLPLPWQALLPAAGLARRLRLPVPGLLRPAVLRYRFAPRTYSNARARQALGWTPEAFA